MSKHRKKEKATEENTERKQEPDLSEKEMLAQSKMKRSKRNRIIRLSVAGVSGVLLLLAGVVVKSELAREILQWFAALLTGIFIIGDFFRTGVRLHTHSTEFFVLLAFLLSIFYYRPSDVAWIGFLYSVVKLIEMTVIGRVARGGEEVQLPYREYEREHRKFQSTFWVLMCLGLLTCLVISKLFLKLDWRDTVFRMIPAGLALTSFFSEKAIFAMRYAAAVELAKDGIYLSNADYLSNLSDAAVLVFEKYGVLTRGRYLISDTSTYFDYTKNEIIEILAYGHYYSKHPIADLFRSKYGKTVVPQYIEDYEDLGGRGMTFKLAGEPYLIGNASLLKEYSISPFESENAPLTLYVVKDAEIIGSVELVDEMREDVFSQLERIESSGVNRFVMLSSESEKLSKRLASAVGIEEVYFDLSEKEKLRYLAEITAMEKESVLYVVSGKANGAMFENADIGILLNNNGPESASADVWIPKGNLDSVSDVIALSKRVSKRRLVSLFAPFVLRWLLFFFAVFGLSQTVEVAVINVIVSCVIFLTLTRPFSEK